MPQHYRSGLNSIPTTDAYMADPNDGYLLRLAAGSIGGVLANIEVGSGAPSMGFHADHANLFYDPASGDHGLSMFGHGQNSASFVAHTEDEGWLCYFCDLSATARGATAGGGTASAASILVTPRDAYRRRAFIAPLGLLLSAGGCPAALLPCCPAALPPCRPAALPPCRPAALPPCRPATLPPCRPLIAPLASSSPQTVDSRGCAVAWTTAATSAA